jgi:hypothetical protein
MQLSGNWWAAERDIDGLTRDPTSHCRKVCLFGIDFNDQEMAISSTIDDIE